MARVALGKAKKASAGGGSKKGPSGKGKGAGTNPADAPGETLLPPPGTFDPGLAAQIRSSERGLEDLIEKAKREGKRERVDVLQKRREQLREMHRGLYDIGRQKQYSIEDTQFARDQLGINFSRAITDLSTAKQRGTEDYERTLTDMQHRYATLAVRQQEGAVEQGTGERGTTAASAAVRGANLSHDKGAVDLSHLRDVQDLLRREGRLTEDYGTNLGRLQTEQDRRLLDFGVRGRRVHQDTSTALHTLARTAQRSRRDRELEVSKAKREQGIYATDVSEQAFYQAHKENPNLVFPSSGPYGAGGAHEPGPGVGNAKPVYGIGPGVAFPSVSRGYPVSKRPTRFGY